MTFKYAKSILTKHNLEADGKNIFNAFNKIELLEALLIAGADANYVEPQFNVTVLSLAHSRNEYTNFRLLLEYGANPDTPLSTFVNGEPIIFEIASPQKGVDSFLRPMINAGINLNQLHPESGYTLLQHAASRYYVSLENLEFLIENGADPNFPNRDGLTLYDLFNDGKISLPKRIVIALKKHQTGYVEGPLELQIVRLAQKPELDTHFYNARGSFRIVKVFDKTNDTLTVRMYRTKQHDADFPRTHTDSLNIIFSLIENSKTPSAWKDAISVFYFDQNHIATARHYIKSHIVSDFDLTFHKELWEEKGVKTFSEIDEKMLVKLQQATITITVNEPEMLDTIEIGSLVKVPEFNVSSLWYLENKTTFQYFLFYVSDGGRWIAKEGEIGTEAKGKVIGGISPGYYKEENNRAEAFVFKKLDEGFELIYKNFDTAYNLEEGIEEAMRQAKINENKNQDYSEEAFEAIKNKDVAKLVEILETGVHPDTLKDNYGNYAIETIGRNWHPEAVHLEMFKLLLDFGADPNKTNYDKLLIQEFTIRATNEFGDEMVRSLVEAGSDINAISPEGLSTLHCACRSGMLWFVQYLLESGADANLKDKDEERTPLHYVLQSKRNGAAIIDLLLEYGADKNSLYTFYRYKNAFELTATIEVVEKLVEIGFDINMANKNGYPSIVEIAEYGSSEIFGAFLKLGGNHEMNMILYRLYEPLSKNYQDRIESQIKKMRILYDLGHSLTWSVEHNPIDYFLDFNLKKRKKITKWEQKALLDLWEMDCAPRRLYKLNELYEYVTKVNFKPMIEKVGQRIAEVQAALN